MDPSISPAPEEEYGGIHEHEERSAARFERSGQGGSGEEEPLEQVGGASLSLEEAGVVAQGRQRESAEYVPLREIVRFRACDMRRKLFLRHPYMLTHIQIDVADARS